MGSSEQSLVQVALRRSLAVIELAVAGGLLLLGYDLWTSERVGGDGIATGFAWLFGVFFMLISLGVVLAAIAAWLGRRRWWVWQAAMLAWAAVVPVGSLFVLIIFGALFG